MLLGKVIGTVVSTQVYEGLVGVPMLLVQPLAKDGAEKGAPVVCADGTRMERADMKQLESMIATGE